MQLSEQIIKARQLLNQMEMLNANPELQGKKQLYDTAISLDIVVQSMVFITADYA